jgi:hypothetical protein
MDSTRTELKNTENYFSEGSVPSKIQLWQWTCFACHALHVVSSPRTFSGCPQTSVHGCGLNKGRTVQFLGITCLFKLGRTSKFRHKRTPGPRIGVPMIRCWSRWIIHSLHLLWENPGLSVGGWSRTDPFNRLVQLQSINGNKTHGSFLGLDHIKYEFFGFRSCF